MAFLQCPLATFRSRLFLILCATSAPVAGQKAPSSPDGEIVVSGQRSILGVQAGRVITEDEVASYGLSTIGELVTEIAEERGSRRSGIVYLINGQRVTGLGDIETYPTEAIDSIQVLPIGSGIKVGGSANQQVVNISLKAKVRTYVGRASLGLATDGDFATGNGDISVTDIARPRRVNLALRWRRDDALLEADRDIVQAPGALTDLGQFRTLRPALDELELRASVADQLAPNLNGFVTARLFSGNSQSFLGLGMAGEQLKQRSRRDSGNLDLQLNGEYSDWLLAFNGTYGLDRRSTLTANGNGFNSPIAGATQTRAVTQSAAAEVSATRALLVLPAGPLSLTLRARLSRNSVEAGTSNFVQWNRELGAGIQVPILSAAPGVLKPLGKLNIGIEFSHSRTTRVGALTSATYSFQWEPADWLRLVGSINTGRTPPGVDLIAAPILSTPGVRYLDPLRGETIDIVELSGGNPALGAQRGNNRRLSLELKPLASIPLEITADYMSMRNNDIITVLPPGNSLLLLAFPDRFLRDANGRLTQVDVRPVNFARQTEEQLRYGFELNLPLGKGSGSKVASSGSQGSLTRPRARRQGTRLQLALSHTIQLKSEVLVSPGFAAVDLLSRDAFGFSGTERPRHEFDFSLGVAERGFGIRLAGQHRGQSFLNLIDGNMPNVLRFSPLTTLNFRTFVEGQRLWPSVQWLKGARLSLSITNLTNSRQTVTDSRGETPLLYQTAYRDPTGRLLQFEFRKTF